MLNVSEPCKQASHDAILLWGSTRLVHRSKADPVISAELARVPFHNFTTTDKTNGAPLRGVTCDAGKGYAIKLSVVKCPTQKRLKMLQGTTS